MWSSRNRSKMLLTVRQSSRLAVIVVFISFAMQAITMAAAQNLALSSTTPKLVNGALAAAANPLSNCTNVKSLFETQGISGADIPTQPITGKFSNRQIRFGIVFTYTWISILFLDRRLHFDSHSMEFDFNFMFRANMRVLSIHSKWLHEAYISNSLLVIHCYIHAVCVCVCSPMPKCPWNVACALSTPNLILSSFNVNIKWFICITYVANNSFSLYQALICFYLLTRVRIMKTGKCLHSSSSFFLLPILFVYCVLPFTFVSTWISTIFLHVMF